MKNKIIAAIRLNESIINEAEVKSDGDFVVIVKKDGSEDRFKPVGLTAAEVVDKFKAIMKHSEGRAWQWLRKVEREEERQAEIDAEEHVDESTITEEEDSTTECPYHNLLADLLNKENITVQDYEEAIIKFNEATEIPEERKARIIEILNHIKDEELEHVKEIQECDSILKGEDFGSGEHPIEPSEQENLPPEDNAAIAEPLPSEEITVDDEVEEFESIKEAILPDDEIFKLLKGKEFASYDEVEEALAKAGFEVVEVFKEGEGFNVDLRKDGVEYFVPFCACAGKFCAVLEAPEGKKLEEGLGDWIAAKVGKIIGKGMGLNAREKFVADLQKELGDAVKVVTDGDLIKVKPAEDFIVSIDAVVDASGLNLGELKAVNLKPEELANAVKKVLSTYKGEKKEKSDEIGELSDEEIEIIKNHRANK